MTLSYLNPQNDKNLYIQCSQQETQNTFTLNVFVGIAETESSQNMPLVLLVSDNRAEWSVDFAANTSDCLLHAPLVSKLDPNKIKNM